MQGFIVVCLRFLMIWGEDLIFGCFCVDDWCRWCDCGFGIWCPYGRFGYIYIFYQLENDIGDQLIWLVLFVLGFDFACSYSVPNWFFWFFIYSYLKRMHCFVGICLYVWMIWGKDANFCVLFCRVVDGNIVFDGFLGFLWNLMPLWMLESCMVKLLWFDLFNGGRCVFCRSWEIMPAFAVHWQEIPACAWLNNWCWVWCENDYHW